jgi:hypothetical protein
MQGFHVKVDVDGCIRDLKATFNSQIPFATSRALNKTAFDCNAEIKKELPLIFDRPTNWTTNALYVKKSTKSNLFASLEYKAWASKGTPSAKVISHHAFGGSRPAKRSEVLLRQKGLIPANSFIVPSSYANVDQYGNVKRSEISKMLSGLQATFDTQQYSKGKKRKSWYVSRNKKIIFFRQSGIALPIFYIVDSLLYDERYDPEQIIDMTAGRVFKGNFEEALKYAIETAR